LSLNSNVPSLKDGIGRFVMPLDHQRSAINTEQAEITEKNYNG